MDIQQPICPERDFVASFEIQNIGDASLSGDLPVSYYNGDPTAPGSILLQTDFYTLSNFDPGDVFAVNNITVTGPGSAFDLYIVLNDNGTSIPTPISLPNTNFTECDYSNNIVSAAVTPGPFTLNIDPTNNFTCAGSAVPANGSAYAFRQVGTDRVTQDYVFEWWNGTDTSGPSDYTGPIYTGLAAGTYTVIATHATAGCSSDPAEVTITDQIATIDAAITIDAPFTNCASPNGALSVVVNGGDPVGDFEYEWYCR